MARRSMKWLVRRPDLGRRLWPGSQPCFLTLGEALRLPPSPAASSGVEAEPQRERRQQHPVEPLIILGQETTPADALALSVLLILSWTLWLLGMATSVLLGGFIHLVLLMAVLLTLLKFVQRAEDGAAELEPAPEDSALG